MSVQKAPLDIGENMPKEKCADPTSEIAAKGKRLYLEIPEYSFFHGPSEIGNLDSRFFGREAIIERLKAILTRHETKSGSYLVTGYRGVGKSSLIANVLTQVSVRHARSGGGSRHIRILAPLALLSFFRFEWAGVDLIWILAVFAAVIISWRYLYRNHPRRDDLKLGAPKPRRAVYCERLWRALSVFHAGRDRSPHLRYRLAVQDFFLVGFLHLVALAGFEVSRILQHGRAWPSFKGQLLTYALLYGLAATIAALRSEYLRARRGSSAGAGLRETSSTVFRRLLHVTRNYFNFAHRIYIKVNLGQDDLSEVEILRLIASNVHSRYRDFQRSSLAAFVWRLLRAGCLFFLVGALYYYRPIYEINRGLKLDSKLYAYFPSQSTFALEGGTETFFSVLQTPGVNRGFNRAVLARELARKLKPDYRVTGAYPMILEPQVAAGASGSVRSLALFVCNYGDLFLQLTYRKIVESVPPFSWIFGRQLNNLSRKMIHPVSPRFQLVPGQLDYLFIVYFLLSWALIRFLFRLELVGIVTHGRVLEKLRELKDAIEAQVTKEQGGGFGSAQKVGFPHLIRKSQKVYGVAGVREIEKRLIDIFNDIDRIPRLTARPTFIFIFDELDKVEAHANLTLVQKEEESPQLSSSKDGTPTSYEATRERQHRLLSLLSNLKHFFTTAKAKFIFIAGREMYDASLADVSDRQFFMGSLFNDVIYVPSFLRDPSDRRLADITSMTEHYVCRFLLPESYCDERATLRTYREYLEEAYLPDSDGNELSESERDLRRVKREWIIFSLRSFIVYLTYRSNGAPKKITRLFESHIRRVPIADLKNESALTLGRCSESLYLEFGFYDLYTFGLVSYIANPLFLSLNRTMKDFGDKLLVSISFLIDHIYKFHRFGFSWRNLELIPEIVDINRAPELRELVSSLVNFLSNTNIDDIVNGLYDFKFRKQVIEEIAFLSKISEREAAAFNFTLDESLSLKRHYNRRLLELLANYKIEDLNRQDSYIHSVGFVRMILGDLHFYDEEYDQAIAHYMEAVQSMQAIDPGKLNVNRMVLMTRNLLKLGLAFEKKKTFDSALVTYGKLVSTIVQFRDLDLKGLGLVWDSPRKGEPKRLFEESDSRWALGFAESTKGWREFAEACENLEFCDALEGVSMKVTAFSAIRLLFQPLVAKLQVLEKVSLGGISPADLRAVEREFEFLVRILGPEERRFPTAEFKEKVGDVLFFKNGPVSLELVHNDSDVGETKGVHCTSPNAGCSRNRYLREKIVKRGYRAPCAACGQYFASLREMCRNALGEQIVIGAKNLLLTLLNSFEAPSLKGQRATSARSFAALLSDVGDTFLSCASAEDESIAEDFLEALVDAVPSGEQRSGRQKIDLVLQRREERSLSKLEETLLSYLLAALFYKRAGEHKSHSFQLVKILYVLREYIAVRAKVPFDDVLLARIKATIVARAIRGIYRAYGSTHRLEIELYQEILDFDSSPSVREENVQLRNLSVNFDLREIIVAFEEILLKMDEKRAISDVDLLTHGRWLTEPYRFVSPYVVVNSIYNRIHELRFRGNVNYRNFRYFGFDELDFLGGAGHLSRILLAPRAARCEAFADWCARRARPANKDEGASATRPCSMGSGELRELHWPQSRSVVMEFLIVDSIFCFREVIRSLQIYGMSYMANHSMHAAAHEKLAHWCLYYFAYRKHCGDGARVRIQRKLEEMIGSAEMVTVSPNYHREQAISHYRSAMQVHNEGRAYKEIISRMYYLDDDFGDELTHFCAGLERYRVNSGLLERRIERLTEGLQQTRLYDLDRYFEPLNLGEDV